MGEPCPVMACCNTDAHVNLQQPLVFRYSQMLGHYTSTNNSKFQILGLGPIDYKSGSPSYPDGYIMIKLIISSPLFLALKGSPVSHLIVSIFLCVCLSVRLK